MTHYDFFGIERNASDDEIKTAYKNMAKKYHPDVYQGSSDVAHERMQQINAAYTTLINSAEREAYDFSLWLEDKQSIEEIYAARYGVYEPVVPRRKTRGIFRPKSEQARRIMRIVWFIRVVIITFVVYMAVGIIFRLPSALDTLDRIYGRGPPARVAQLYFNSLTSQDFGRNEQLTGGSMSGIRNNVQQAFEFEVHSVRYGEIIFANLPRDLKIRVTGVKRMDFSGSSVTVRVTNVNIKQLFIDAQNAIITDMNSGLGEMVLRRAIVYSDISLVPEIYRTYIRKQETETITQEFTFELFRPGMWWNVVSVCDAEELQRIILGGFTDYMYYGFIDWVEVLKLDVQ